MELFALKSVNYKNIINYPDITIPAGCVTFICGESGSGKSTLLKLLNGSISPTYGEIKYLNQNIEEYDSIILRRNVLLVSQSVYLFDMSVKDNFAEFYSYRDIKTISDDEINKFLKICSIDQSINNMCSVMSGGEKHRVCVAINLSFQSDVLMLDEPTSALDSKNADMLMKNLKSYCTQNNKTLIVVSHDQDIYNNYADNIIMLSRGVNCE